MDVGQKCKQHGNTKMHEEGTMVVVVMMVAVAAMGEGWSVVSHFFSPPTEKLKDGGI